MVSIPRQISTLLATLFQRTHKCIDSSKGECGDTLPPKNQFSVTIWQFKKKGICDKILSFHKTMSPIDDFLAQKFCPKKKILISNTHTHKNMFKICVFTNGTWEEPSKPAHVQDAGDVLWLELGFWRVLGPPRDRSWVPIWQAAARPFYRTTSVNTPCGLWQNHVSAVVCTTHWCPRSS
jgi:hypothetical protein